MGLSWHWHRMRAMTLEEVCLRAQLRLRQRTDSGRTWESPRVALEGIGAFPRLPSAEDAPPELREALSRDAQKILAGNWKAFGHLDLQIDDPPKWHHDYLAAGILRRLNRALRSTIASSRETLTSNLSGS